MRNKNQVNFWLYILLTSSIIVITLLNIRKYSLLSLGIALLTLVFMSLPFLIENKLGLKIPRDFVVIFLVFLYLAMFLGTANHFYDQFWWWDNMSHSFSGVVFADLGFLIARYLTQEIRKNIATIGNAKRLLVSYKVLVVLFAFCFAVTSGAIWEIYEFSMDKTFGTLYQGIGIDDTMIDIILDTLGALAFSIAVYRFRKN